MNIYKITNLKTGKIYVGQTSLLIEERLANHKRKAGKINRYLYDSMNFHGVENFIVELIEQTTKKEADARETFWIAELGSLHPNGYNMTVGGGGGHTIAAWDDARKRAHYKAQGEKRKGKRPEAWRKAIAAGAIKREASLTRDQKVDRAKRSVETARLRGYKSQPPKPKYGAENKNFVVIDIERCKQLIKFQWKLKDIAEEFSTTTVTVSAKLKAATGKTFVDWRREYGIRGSFGRVQRLDPA